MPDDEIDHARSTGERRLGEPQRRVAATVDDLRGRAGSYHRRLLREMLLTGGE